MSWSMMVVDAVTVLVWEECLHVWLVSTCVEQLVVEVCGVWSFAV